MPNLRIFDINRRGYGRFHNLIDQFNSLFWTERKWFFAHQHTSREDLNWGTFYSTPYRYNYTLNLFKYYFYVLFSRGKDYTFCWESDNQLCPSVQKTDLNSKKYNIIALLFF